MLHFGTLTMSDRKRTATQKELDEIESSRSSAAYVLLDYFKPCPRSLALRARISRRMALSSLDVVPAYKRAIRANPTDTSLASELVDVLSTDVLHVPAYYAAATRAGDQAHVANACNKLRASGCHFGFCDSSISPVSDLIKVLKQIPEISMLHLSNLPRQKRVPSALATALEKAVGITSLSISNCPGADLQQIVSEMTWLQCLTSRFNPHATVLQLDDMLARLSGLVKLSIHSWNSITVLPGCLAAVPGLRTFEVLSCPKLSCIPRFIGNMLQLRILIFSGCHLIREIPTEIDQLSQLETLCIAGCKLTVVPDALCALLLLKTLDLSNNSSLKTVPSRLGLLPNLETLRLANCLLLRMRHPIYTRTICRITLAYLQARYSPSKLLVLILVARRRRVRHLPDELWMMILKDHTWCPECRLGGCDCTSL